MAASHLEALVLLLLVLLATCGAVIGGDDAACCLCAVVLLCVMKVQVHWLCIHIHWGCRTGCVGHQEHRWFQMGCCFCRRSRC
jgi:hypothetical protein